MTFNTYILLLAVITVVGVAIIWNDVFASEKRKSNILNYTVLASFVGLLITGYFLDPWEILVTAAAAIGGAYWAVQSGRFKKIDVPMIVIFTGGGVVAGYILYNIFGALTNNWGSLPAMAYVVVMCVLMAQGVLDTIKINGVTAFADKKKAASSQKKTTKK